MDWKLELENDWLSDEQGKLEYQKSIVDFIGNSPSPYHASKTMADYLESAGFERLEETDDWNLVPDGRYFVTRNDTSLIAFRNGSSSPKSKGIRAIGAHLDSPCLKLTPKPHFSSPYPHRYDQLNVEVYGSPLLRTWFDRDLSVAGRVFYRDAAGVIQKELVDLKIPVAVVPSIAIHLDREANKNQNINSQVHLNPILTVGVDMDYEESFKDLIFNRPVSIGDDCIGRELLGHDLSLYDTNGPTVTEDFLSSARIDNLLSCHAGMVAMTQAETDNFCILVCNDHEEVGSGSDSGAKGSFLASVLERTVGMDAQVIRRSMLLSADGAHGIHPNYPEKHDTQHAPALNGGLVIKVNSNQSYASTGESVAVVRDLCYELDLWVQVFSSRNNIPCGTTIGPITASEIGIKTVDIGVAQFAMHSIREIAGLHDGFEFIKLLMGFLQTDSVTI